MKNFCLYPTALLVALVVGCGQAPPSPIANSDNKAAAKQSPLEVVNARMDAYNSHDLERFLGNYAEEVTIFTYPDKSLGGGRDHLCSIFGPMFEKGETRVTIQHQIAKDSYVVNHESVNTEGTKTEYVSIYEVRKGLIQSVRFVRD